MTKNLIRIMDVEKLISCRDELELWTYSTDWRDKKKEYFLILNNIKFNNTNSFNNVGSKFFFYSSEFKDILICEEYFPQYKFGISKEDIDILLLDKIYGILSKYDYPDLCFTKVIPRYDDIYHRKYLYNSKTNKYELKCQK